MADVDSLFESQWVRACDLRGQPRTVTIAKITTEVVGRFEEHLPVIWFDGKKKGMVLNKTNAAAIAEIYGRETDHWLGQPITLFPTTAKVEGRVVPAVRIRAAKDSNK